MAVKNEIWILAPRDFAGRLEESLEELLVEGNILARRIGADLVVWSELPPEEKLNAQVKQFGGRIEHLPPGASVFFDLQSESQRWNQALEFGAPRVLLLAANSKTRALAPLIAGYWKNPEGCTLVTQVTSITADANSKIVVRRPVFGEQGEQLMHSPLGTSVIATLIPGVVGTTGNFPKEDSKIIEESQQESLFAPEPSTVDISEAERVVAFGRGAFGKEGVSLVSRLAEVLGASLAGTRPAADEGWIPFSRQIGLTGAVVKPRLYVAVGISGAPYHMAGVKEPDILISINNDPDAPIIASSHLSIVGDLFQVIPKLIEQLEGGKGWILDDGREVHQSMSGDFTSEDETGARDIDG